MPGSARRRAPLERASRRAFWPFVAPAVVLYALFMLGPAVGTVVMSFTRWDGLGDARFVGVAQYLRLFRDELFWMSMRNSLVILVGVGAAVFVVSFAIVVVLRDMPGRRFVRSVLFFPHLISALVVGILIGFVLQTDGAVDGILAAIGVDAAPNWLGDHLFAVVCGGLIWVSTGFYVTLIMTGVDQIPPALYDEAQLAGANAWQRFRHVTLPLSWEVVSAAAVLWTISSVKVFEYVLAFGGSTTSLPPVDTWNTALFIYAKTFGGAAPAYEFGYASAAAVVTLAAIAVVVVLFRRLTRRGDRAPRAPRRSSLSRPARVARASISTSSISGPRRSSLSRPPRAPRASISTSSISGDRRSSLSRPPRAARHAARAAVWALVAGNLLVLLWMLSTSLREHSGIFADPLGLALPPTLSNFVAAWNESDFGTATLNSIVVTTAAALLTQIVATPAGYALARLPSRASGPVQLAFVLGLGVPMQVLIVPLFTLAARLGLIDSLAGLIIVYAAVSLPLAVFLMTAFFTAIPADIEEAAAIDGAGPGRTLWWVLVPAVRPGIVTALTLTAVGIWNETLVALVFVQSPEIRTLPLALYSFVTRQQYGGADYGQLFAGFALIVLPILLVYLWLGRRIVDGVAARPVR